MIYLLIWWMLNENGRAVFAGDARCFNRDVETIFHRCGRQDNARAVAVSAENGLEKIALLDIGGQAGARSAALNVDTISGISDMEPSRWLQS